VVLPTGTGKSGVAATLKRELIDQYGDMRILNVTHVAELVAQNHAELMGMWPWAPAGIYSAGLGMRDIRSQIVFAGIQSIHRKVQRLGTVDLLMVDEAHTIPRKSETMYGRFIAALREANPDMRLLGLTATPYRLDSGRLDEGEDRMFDAIAFEYGIRSAIDEGYLKPLVSKATATALDTTGVAKRGGEFVAGELQAAVDKADLNRGIIDDVMRYGHDRRSWLVFAAGVEHAHHLRDEIRRRGVDAEVVTGDTDTHERRRILEAFRAQRLRAVVNCGVLTTGFNAPGIDLIAAARPTESTGLYVQIAGRGTRPVYAPGMPLDTQEERLAAIAAGPCPNCLFLDFGGLVRRHGPVDMVKPRKPGKGGGDAPVKVCPECFSLVHASVMACPDCGHEWERELSNKITRNAAIGPILSVGQATWKTVQQRRFARHDKFGAATSMRVEYVTELGGNLAGVGSVFKEWVPFENEKARGIATRWWKQHGGLEPCPETTSEALRRAGELRPVETIRIEPSGKFWRITGRTCAPAGTGNADEVAHHDPFTSNARLVAGQAMEEFNRRERALEVSDDDVPF
jgi:DNA repair protein RadD